MKRSTFNDHLLYWIVPTFLMLLLIMTFYLNWFGLSEIIAPKINREFGIVENIQNILLILIFLLALKGFRTQEIRIEKYGYALIMVATVFMFLEEIDYGLHYYDYITGKRDDEVTKIEIFNEEVRNFHNNGRVILNVLKLVSYTVIILFFVALPLLPSSIKTKFPLLKYLSPSTLIISTAASLLILNQIALYLYKHYDYNNPSLDRNVSEFEEIMTYYIIFLYLREMVSKPKQLSYLAFKRKPHKHEMLQ
jgi:hypothetical protein